MNTLNPEVSIVIINYNKFHLTVQCIQSIYEKTSLPIEIILVDNASSECNPNLFLEVIPDILLIANSENKGFARGCNDGIRVASAPYILLLNNDTVLLNDAVTIVFEFLKKNPQVAFATCKILNPDGSPQHNCQSFPFRWKQMLEVSRLHKLLPSSRRAQILWGSYFQYDTLAFPDWIWGTFMMFHRQLLNIFPEKKLPETFWMYCEDLEWCWLAHKAGFQNAFIPEAKIIHFSPSHIHTDTEKQSLIHQNYEYFIRKYLR